MINLKFTDELREDQWRRESVPKDAAPAVETEPAP